MCSDHPSILTILAIPGLAGCSGISAEQPIRSDSHPLAEHQRAKLSPTVSVRDKRFEDSRCPKNTVGIWVGKFNYHFALSSKSGSERFAPGGGGERHASTTLPGVRFRVAFIGVRERPLAEHAVVLEVEVFQLARR